MMRNFSNWKEVTKGLYRYVVAASVAYEIHILYWDTSTDIQTAKANLYLVGEWRAPSKQTTLERQLISAELPVSECLNKAYEDDKQNNIVS